MRSSCPRARGTEVDDLHDRATLPRLGDEEDVARLHVAVEHRGRVRRREAGQRLEGDVERLDDAEARPSPDGLRARSPRGAPSPTKGLPSGSSPASSVAHTFGWAIDAEMTASRCTRFTSSRAAAERGMQRIHSDRPRRGRGRSRGGCRPGRPSRATGRECSGLRRKALLRSTFRARLPTSPAANQQASYPAGSEPRCTPSATGRPFARPASAHRSAYWTLRSSMSNTSVAFGRIEPDP